jgi:hypothetical protein
MVAARKQIAAKLVERQKAAKVREAKLVEAAAELVAAVQARHEADLDAARAVRRLFELQLSAPEVVDWAADPAIDLREVQRLKTLHSGGGADARAA